MSRFKKVNLVPEQERAYKRFTGMRPPKNIKAEPVATVVKKDSKEEQEKEKEESGSLPKGTSRDEMTKYGLYPFSWWREYSSDDLSDLYSSRFYFYDGIFPHSWLSNTVWDPFERYRREEYEEAVFQYDGYEIPAVRYIWGTFYLPLAYFNKRGISIDEFCKTFESEKKIIYLRGDHERPYVDENGIIPKVVDSDPRTKKIPGARSKGKLWS